MTENNPQTHVIVLSEARRALDNACSLEEIHAIRDKAEAVRHYAQSAALGLELQNYAAEVKLRAERKAGQLLSKLKLWGGDRRSRLHGDTLKLEEVGLSRLQSSRWQLEGSVPEQVFEAYVVKARDEHKELTARGLIRLAKGYRERPPKPQRKWRKRTPDREKTLDGTAAGGNQLNGKTQFVAEQLNELANHFGLLSTITRPLLNSVDAKSMNIDRRLALRLFSDIESVITELRRLLNIGHRF
jgi:hypothetical protein